MVTLSVVIGLQYRSLAVLVFNIYLSISLHKYLTVCFCVSYFMMATVRAVYAVELLTKADLHFSAEATTTVLLLLVREAGHRPAESKVLPGLTCEAIYSKEQAGELFAILSKFSDIHESCVA